MRLLISRSNEQSCENVHLRYSKFFSTHTHTPLLYKHYIYSYSTGNYAFCWTDHCSHDLCGCDDLQPHTLHTGEVKYVTQFGDIINRGICVLST